MGPEKIRFKREVNGRKVCKELIARIEPRGCTSETGDKNYKQWQRYARASAHGLRAIMETMLHGSQFYMLFKEAFHIYGSFFETKKDEETFRDILLHLETGLNVVIVTHPVTVYTLVLGSITSRCSGKSARTHPPKELSFREGSKTGPGRRRKSSLHLCEFREKVRQYCINKFVRTT